MNGQLFYIGQSVTPNSNSWVVEKAGKGMPPFPKFGEVYTVAEYDSLRGQWYISLEEIKVDAFYLQEAFSPVITDEVLTSELETIKEPVTI